jgi:hypothetical protein
MSPLDDCVPGKHCAVIFDQLVLKPVELPDDLQYSRILFPDLAGDFLLAERSVIRTQTLE